jgi:hypothetical protein
VPALRITFKAGMRPHYSRVTFVRLGLLFTAWTAYGLLCTWQAHYWYSVSKTPMSWAEALRFEMTYAYLWGAFSPLILWFARKFRLERAHWPRNLAVHVILMFLLVPVIKVAFDLIAAPPTSPFHAFTWEKLLHSVQSTYDMGILLYAVVVVVEHAVIYYQRYQSGLIKAAQLQTQLIQAQLQALKMQLHPHFLFNTLHTITALVHEDPDMAERTITRLSELLRLFLANSAIHELRCARSGERGYRPKPGAAASGGKCNPARCRKAGRTRMDLNLRGALRRDAGLKGHR